MSGGWEGGGTVLRITELVTKPAELSLILRTNMMKGENWLPRYPLASTGTLAHECPSAK